MFLVNPSFGDAKIVVSILSVLAQVFPSQSLRTRAQKVKS
jgi:hypothetical protein